MTQQEKAQQLVNKYYNTIASTFYFDWAKTCAIYAVDEILASIEAEQEDGGVIDEGCAADYWQRVKYEIQKLSV